MPKGRYHPKLDHGTNSTKVDGRSKIPTLNHDESNLESNSEEKANSQPLPVPPRSKFKFHIKDKRDYPIPAAITSTSKLGLDYLAKLKSNRSAKLDKKGARHKKSESSVNQKARNRLSSNSNRKLSLKATFRTVSIPKITAQISKTLHVKPRYSRDESHAYDALEFKMTSRKSTNTNASNCASVYISNQAQTTGGPCLFLIDPQYDFVYGTLTVPGAVEDCSRLATFLHNNLTMFQEIYVTLDTHMLYHIAHPMYWVDIDGKHPEPFTAITHKDVASGRWVPSHMKTLPTATPTTDMSTTDKTKGTHHEEKTSTDMSETDSDNSWELQYTKELEQKSRLPGLAAFTLTVWPPHCLLGSEGHNVEEKLYVALKAWEQENNKCVHYIVKGNNSKTEHYSAFRAEVIVPDDPDTQFNEVLYENLKKHSHIYIGGEAKSHCVNFTVRDLVDRMEKEVNDPGNKNFNGVDLKDKIVLLDGGMSDVVGCKDMGDKMWKDMVNNKGIRHHNIKENPTWNAAYGTVLKRVNTNDLPSTMQFERMSLRLGAKKYMDSRKYAIDEGDDMKNGK